MKIAILTVTIFSDKKEHQLLLQINLFNDNIRYIFKDIK